MNDDYLWDKTGEPDTEIQRLEEVLGALRYQPRPLELPASRPTAFRKFFPSLAIAAAITLMLLAAGLWFAFNRQRVAVPLQAKQPEQKSNGKPEPSSIPNQTPKPEQQNNHQRLAGDRSPRHRPARSVLARTKLPPPKDKSLAAELTPYERDEAMAAKDQLMLALRVASAKLNLAQRRTQAPTPNNIRNQHKVG